MPNGIARNLSTFLALLAPLAVASACADRTVVVAKDPELTSTPRDSGADAQPPDSSAPDGTTSDGGEVVVLCANGPCACNDGVDNDGDGRLDGYDPECTGPFDDDEQSFGTGLPTGGRGKCQDCFFDDNASSVDDGCSYNRVCLTGGVPASNDRCGCDVAPACYGSCRQRTPNGCDCFGCCQVQNAAGETRVVRLSEGCTQATLDDERRCEPCVLNEKCENPCGPCELCPGRGPDQLPPICAGPTGGETQFGCDDGRACDEARPCLDGFYCLQGCCIPFVF